MHTTSSTDPTPGPTPTGPTPTPSTDPTPGPLTAPSHERSARHRLRTVLRLNAGTSIVAGLLMAVAPRSVDALLDTGHPGWIRLVGIGLVLFGVDVLWLSPASAEGLRRWTPFVVAADVAWVAASVVTILLGWYSTGGVIVVLAMAAAVDSFALLQWRAWRRQTTR